MKNLGQSICILFFAFLLSASAGFAQVTAPNFPDEGILSRDTNHFIDEQFDYSQFTGRVSDKGDEDKLFKIQVENKNAKFFRAGDVVYFRVRNTPGIKKCKGYVRTVEDGYFSILVQDLTLCYSDERYFRRGTVLEFSSKILAQRVFEASKYREMLLIRKEDFLKQLNGINNFIWGYDQHKVKTAIQYDERIAKLEREKQRAIDNLLLKKKESLVLQNELKRKLNSIDESLKYYRIERLEPMSDRWNLDHHKGLPFGKRPMALKEP